MCEPSELQVTACSTANWIFFSEAHNVIIKLLTGTLAMAFAGDAEASSQWYLSVEGSSVGAE